MKHLLGMRTQMHLYDGYLGAYLTSSLNVCTKSNLNQHEKIDNHRVIYYWSSLVGRQHENKQFDRADVTFK